MDIESKVKLFLAQLENNYQNDNYFLSRRKDEKLNALLRQFGWTKQILFEYLIKNLKPDDYISGPEDEHGNADGSVWKFGKIINSVEVYIKISHMPNGSKCISFHETEYDICYPFKGGN